MNELSLAYEEIVDLSVGCNYNPDAPCYDGGCRDTSQGCHGCEHD